MQPEQDLHQAVSDQLVQRQQFPIRASDGLGIARICRCRRRPSAHRSLL